MSTAKAAIKAGKKKTGEDEGPKKANNVAIGTITEVKAAENDGVSAANKPGEDQKYVYRDFSLIPEEDFDVDYEIDQEGLLQVSFTDIVQGKLKDGGGSETNKTLSPRCFISFCIIC